MLLSRAQSLPIGSAVQNVEARDRQIWRGVPSLCNGTWGTVASLLDHDDVTADRRLLSRSAERRVPAPRAVLVVSEASNRPTMTVAAAHPMGRTARSSISWRSTIEMRITGRLGKVRATS